VESPRVWVIDSSPTIRETIAIVLGTDYQVQVVDPTQHSRDAGRVDAADLLIIEAGSLSGAALSALPVGCPILWLRRDARFSPPRTQGVWATLDRRFSPEALRTQVAELLARRAEAMFTGSAAVGMEYPLLPRDAAGLAERAARTTLPILLCGEAGTGKARLARAIHGRSRASRFVTLPASACTAATLAQIGQLAAGPLTVFVHDIVELTVDRQAVLRELLESGGFESGAGWHVVRLISATTRGFDGLAESSGLDRDLVYRLSVVPITLPPLRERPGDVPALVDRLTSDLVRLLGIAPVTFTPRALERLARYLWFGNLAELETVLTRTLALTEHRPIDAEDLLFGYGRVTPRARVVSDVPTRDIGHAATGSTTVDLVINELAHEFKNPMVTIKTVAQHLERLLEDEAGRAQVARLTGDAVDRMDRALENLLQYTRFQAPAPENVPLSALLAPSLSELTPLLTERRLLLNYQPADRSRVYVDPAQTAYAFENLLRVVVRDLREGETLTVRTVPTPPTVHIEFPTIHRSTAAKLADYLEHPRNGDGADAPLGLVFAKTLVERNGGRMDARETGDATLISVRLPAHEETTATDEQTANLDS